MDWFIKKIVGTKNERDLKKIRPLVEAINAKEIEYQQLSEEQLKAKTPEFQQRLRDGESVEDVLIEAYAVVKNACRRLVGTVFDVVGHDKTWVEIPYDVQLIGGIGIHRGMIAEMATGEGKTLVATCPTYLNALTGNGVHIVTVNDYLAKRDAEWMGFLYQYLGLTIGVIQSGMHSSERRENYAKDVTYGTNSEFGFDYLRDNMAYSPDEMVQRGHFYAIIDEIDSILIDEARTPLIISGPAQHSASETYVQEKPVVEKLYRLQNQFCDEVAKEALRLVEAGEDVAAMEKLYQLQQGMPRSKHLLKLQETPSTRRLLEKANNQYLTDTYKERARELREDLYFTIDEKHNDAGLTEKGTAAISPEDPDAYMLPDLATEMSMLEGDMEMPEEEKITRRQQLQDAFTIKSEKIHAVDQLIRAYCVYEHDVQYVVENNQVVIVDENTGRKMEGRRWSDGLHQAVEAKEGVKVERETQTLATVTIQNYFRMYDKLSGMTGTAETEADEFAQIYKLDVLVIPTNRPIRRVDYDDPIYKTEREKYAAVVEEIIECYQRKQPVLVGTVSVEKSELVGRMLRKANIPHNVLNAKHHMREAEIVERAGQPGAITIATNMAGRGTDIKLGKGVIKVDPETLAGQISLKEQYEGKSLNEWLRETPCGLYVIATERHESRRVDRQLRGRCARQGDPGMSRFYVSLEDNLMRLFGAERISNIMDRLGIEEGEVLEHSMLNKSIERAEEQNFSQRKRTLDYDDVMNKQREVVYGMRSDILRSDVVRDQLYVAIEESLLTRAQMIGDFTIEGNRFEFRNWVNMTFPLGMTDEELQPLEKSAEAYTAYSMDRVKTAYQLKLDSEDEEQVISMERTIMLQSIDTHWQEYLREIDALRQAIGLRGIGQKDPLIEFKHEAYKMFEGLMERIYEEMCYRIFRSTTSIEALEKFLASLNTKTVHEESSALANAQRMVDANHDNKQRNEANERALEEALEKPEPVRRDTPKVGRNDPCPCGSGKKYKKCHGAE
ncbi:MAG: preprotein translocase subunit SecA [Verrucomicrobiales bacterium]|jgi:preprotein translocase subunit SecA